jgi:phosphoenolpyruvate synthase/pyruvate phosphate dikinase
MMPLILNWPQAYEAGLMACGGKGHHLAKLQRYGFPVPDGGVVVANVYRQLMRAPVLAEHAQAVSTLRAEEVTAPTVSRIP